MNCLPHLLRAVPLVLALASGGAHALEITLPPETATLRPEAAPGAQSAVQCFMCHSVDYISTQPAMPLGFWDAEVKKMVGTFGAPIAADQIPLIVQYLNEAYPPVASAKP